MLTIVIYAFLKLLHLFYTVSTLTFFDHKDTTACA